MRRIISVIFSLVLCLSLCACGKSDAVKIVETLIDEIGQVTLESEDAILIALDAYSTLTDKEKEQVENYDQLIQAREDFTLLVEQTRLSWLTEQRWININDCDIITLAPDRTGTHQVYQLTGTLNLARAPECSEYPVTYNADDETVTIAQEGALLVMQWDWQAQIPTLTAEDGSVYVQESNYSAIAAGIRRQSISTLLSWERWGIPDGTGYLTFQNGSTGNLVNTQYNVDQPILWQLEDNDSVGVQFRFSDNQLGVMYADIVEEDGRYILRTDDPDVYYTPDGQYQPPGFDKDPARILSVTAAYGYSLALRADGTVIARGFNESGQCNVGSWKDIIAISGANKHSLGLLPDGTVIATGNNDQNQCEVTGWTDITAISAGFFHSVGLKSDGTVVATGDNSCAQLDVSEWTDIIAISAGGHHTVGLRADGTVVATGFNDDGRCDVSGWTEIVAVSAGYGHTLGLKADGTVVAAGDNSQNQCDTSQWTNVISISAGYVHSLGVRSDGTVAAIGNNSRNQCDVYGWEGVDTVSGGGFHTIGLRKDGTLFVIGVNNNGQSEVLLW